jgi:hypothetical protein
MNPAPFFSEIGKKDSSKTRIGRDFWPMQSHIVGQSGKRRPTV